MIFPVYVDKEVAMMKNFIVGANETDMHYKNVNINKDFTPTEVADIRTIRKQATFALSVASL